ncbi:TetR/AcrR family transcriptional regulator C-terminal domain-containing protein [Petropleomorpha daqingensis]|uniref:DNA-binding transcriptional regulator YhcF (GntR family) n=1 Tax=Petropleomorpha daqingensis TaxID=2026353 RepID=A0A853CBA2_9ACTN|nr:TetR/AcrR family transcriptional regulator C-terminal domain-containing protein [Petropleomorpha daqingensis]NYJ05190.1 DNA-binding transcriptional regulator YhcF (GntR family) [Petropleomorpha daqingensis]
MSQDGAPASARVAAELRRRITAGELAPGARVPSTRAIVQRYGVAMATATKVLTTLQHEGLIRTVPGVGSVVAGAPVERPARRRSSSPEGALGVAAIVAAGTVVADAEGLAALSMRRVAAELDAAPMSLYRHVRDKDELLLQMMDAAISEVALPEPPADWREGLEIAARALWTGFRRHPWLPAALSLTRPQLLPGALEYSEWVLGVLTRAGWDPLTTFTTHLTVFTFVRGLAMNLELESEAEAASGLTDDEWMSGQEQALAALVADGRHPNFTHVLSGMDFDMDLDALFEFGLQRLLAGIAATG